mgnify:CR=1 FL=1
MRFEGIYTPVVTPHSESGEISWDRFSEVLEFLISKGVHGLIIAGTTGEYYAQTHDERLEVMRYAKKIIGDRLPLIVGTGAIRTEESIEFAQEAKSLGADAILVTSPPYAVPTGR